MRITTYFREQWDRVATCIAVALGASALVLGWLGVSNQIYPGEQLPYVVSGGLGGVFLLGLGAMLWISADLRDEWRKLDDIDRSLKAIETALAQTGTEPVLPRTTTGQREGVVPPAEEGSRVGVAATNSLALVSTSGNRGPHDAR